MTAQPMPQEAPSAAPGWAEPSVAPVGYRPQLDGVRAFCIILTIFNHTPGSPSFIRGSVGVDIFFALSGWLITWLLLRERQKTGKISLGAFYIRRIFRIVPLYYVTVLLYFGAATVFRHSAHGGIRDTAGIDRAMLLLATFNGEYRANDAPMFGHAWTLGIEEKFYLVWPFIMLVLGRRPIVAGIAAALAVLILLVTLGAPPTILRGYAGLGMGAAAAVIVDRYPAVRQWLSAHPIGSIALAAMIVPYAGALVWPRPCLWNIVIAALAVPLIATIWFADGQCVSRCLAVRPLAWVGRLTYAIYLLHVLVLNVIERAMDRLHLSVTGLALFAITYAGAILVAWIAHVTIEKPMIRYGRALSNLHVRGGSHQR